MKENKLKTGTTLSTNTNDELSYTYLLSTEKRASSLKYENYNKVASSYNLLILDNLLSNGKCHIVALFKEFLIIDDNSEFLKRYYKIKESLPRIKKVAQYYYETSVIFPNYTPLFESKFIYKNIMKKQKIIDQIQELEDKKDKNKNKKKKDNKNYLNEKVFNDTAYNEILNQSESVLRIVFGLKKENVKLNIFNSDDEEQNDNINDIQNLIEQISQYENNKPETLINTTSKAKLKLTIPILKNKPKLSIQNYQNLQNGNLKTIMDYKNKTNILETPSLRTFSPNSTNYNTINNSTSRNLKKNITLLNNNSVNSNKQCYHKSTLSMPKIKVSSSSKEKKLKLLSFNSIDNNNNKKNYFKNVNISNIKSPPDLKKTHKKIRSVLGTNNGIDILKTLNINFNYNNTIDREKKIFKIKQNDINKRRIKPSIFLHEEFMGFYSERNKK